LVTTLRGTNGALSSSFFDASGASKRYGKTASFQFHKPSTALA
jgi:hypothetical protein